MKKIFYFLSALALFACDKAEDFGQPVQGGVASGADLPEVIYATVDDESEGKTRTVVGEDGQSVLWNTGDAIAYIGPDALRAMYQYEGDDRVATAAFTYKETSSNVPEGAIMPAIPYAVYPYNSGAYCKSTNTLVVNFPAVQNYAANSFGRGANVMIGVGKDNDDTAFTFRNACGYLVIKLYGEGVSVKGITLTALGSEKIAGKGLITASHGEAPTVEMSREGSSTITLKCGEGVALGADAANATEFWFAMPPVTFSEGFKIHVDPTSGLAFEVQTSNQVEITRNEIQPMAALPYTPNAPAPNQVLYTRSDDKKDPVTFYSGGYNGGYNFTQPFDADLTQHYYDESIQKFVMECDDTIKAILQNGLATTRIKTVSLPSQLESIGEFAFYGTDLVEIVIPGSVTVLHKDGFHNCDDLKRVTFLWGKEDLQINDLDGVFMNSNMSDNLQLHESNIDYMYLDRNIRYADKDGEVSSANKLTYSLAPYANEVIIGPNVSKIPPMAFNGADVTRLVIPGNINYIGALALRNLYELEELVIEPSPTNTPLTLEYDESYEITTGPFYLMNSTSGDALQTIRLNREIIYNYQPKNKDEGVFSDRRSLTTVVLGNQVKTISDRMFSDSPELSSVTINGSVTSIGNYAFYDCPKLTSIAINNSLTSIGNYAFKDCDAMTTFTVNGSIGTIGTNAFEDSDALANLNIAGTVGTVGKYAFSDCDAITTLAIRANKVEEYAYEDMDGLLSATLYGATVGDCVFYDCNELQTLVFDGGVNSIGNYAFYNCGSLAKLTFNNGDETLYIGFQPTNSDDVGPFYQSPLTEVNLYRELAYNNDGVRTDEGMFVNKYNLPMEVSLGGSLRTILPYMFYKTGVGAVTFPSTLTTIGDYAFYDCDKITSANLSESLTTIGNSAFENCDGITSVNVPTSVTTMGNNVFKNSDGITSATLGAQTIGTGVLYDCDALAEVTIKGTVNTIGNDAFYSCPSIKKVTFEKSDAAEPTTLTLGYQTYGTGEEGPFHDSNLETVVWRRNISYTLANMGSANQTDEGIFSQNSALTSVTIGDQVKSIPPYTFAASGLSGSVWIPHTVESIGDYAFYDCDNLRGLTLGYDGTTTFPTIGTGVFDGCANFSYIKVRKLQLQKFKDSSVWDAYENKLTTSDDFQ